MSYPSLDLCEGPDCPRCGCQDTEVLDPPRPRGEIMRDGWFASGRRPRRRQSGAQPAVKLPRPPNIGDGEGAAPGRAICKHCGKTFFFRQRPEPEPEPEAAFKQESRPPAGVTYHLVSCPKCDSTDTRITKTARPIRRHKCRACGHPFKSVEKA